MSLIKSQILFSSLYLSDFLCNLLDSEWNKGFIGCKIMSFSKLVFFKITFLVLVFVQNIQKLRNSSILLTGNIIIYMVIMIGYISPFLKVVSILRKTYSQNIGTNLCLVIFLTPKVRTIDFVNCYQLFYYVFSYQSIQIVLKKIEVAVIQINATPMANVKQKVNIPIYLTSYYTIFL